MTPDNHAETRAKLATSLFEGLGSFVDEMTRELSDGLRKAGDEVKREVRAEERERRSNIDPLQEASDAIEYAYGGGVQ